MAFNPLSPEWPKQVADAVDRVVQTIRSKVTTPAVRITNAIVFGLVAVFVGFVAAVVSVLIGVRAVQAYLTWNFGTAAAWIVGAAALLGLLLVLVGAIKSTVALISLGAVLLVFTGARWALHAGDTRIDHDTAVWISYLVVGGLFVFLGTLLMAKRHSPLES